MKLLDTIAAVSTPRGKGGVALIRISGSDALRIGEQVFATASATPLSALPPNQMCYGTVYAKDASGARTAIDDGMAVCFHAPRSFTGEDTVEITCHGGVLITARVLSAVLAAGARPAEAGEFTRRAFLCGKLDLSEAEALGKLLEAQNDNQLLLARNGMRGILTDRTSEFYQSLLTLLGSIYARIDFPDEDLGEMQTEQMTCVLKETRDAIRRLADTYRTGRAVQEGISTVLCGRTNAGKSSVYNRLAGYDAAIVTDIAGTTRDLLRDTVTVGKTTLRLCDTAGLRDTTDTVESIGIRRSLDAIREAELILAVFDASCAPTEEDMQLIETLSTLSTPVIALLNKSDANTHCFDSLLPQHFSRVVSLSAKSGDGFDALAKAVDDLFIDPDIELGQDAIVADARQYAALVRTADSLDTAYHAMSCGVSLDLCCIDVEAAMVALSELEGREVGEEIVSEIFSKFCVGK